MSSKNLSSSTPANHDEISSQTGSRKSEVNRRSFLKNSVTAGAAVTTGVGLLNTLPSALAEQSNSAITRGDAAILRFLAAAEIIESDLWLQYQELGGIQDNEVALLASQQIPHYPPTSPTTTGSAPYITALGQLDGDMSQYIHDNTEDELTHETFINAYLVSKGFEPVNLDKFRTLPSSQATGANKNLGRLTNLMQLTVDTSWWTRYRSRTGNPDLGDTFPQAIPTLAVNKHTAIPRTDNDLNDPDFVQAIANTAGFHFAFIEQGGSSLYPSLAQRVTSAEVLRIVLSIGPVETSHFQTWHDKAGNAVISKAPIIDPVTKVPVFFPDLLSTAVPPVGEDLQSNLIMPEPTFFLSRNFPPVSIIRPTKTQNVAMGAVAGLTADGLFIGQSPAFMMFLKELAMQADSAVRGGH